jgi:rod shape-determining protein MreC
MGDETVQPGDRVVTSGGDRVFPKGLPIGTVVNVSMGRNLFLDITVKPAADLDRLEEVLVITAQKARAPDAAGLGPIRASDILAEHLPGVPQAPPGDAAPQPPPSAPKASPAERQRPAAAALPAEHQRSAAPALPAERQRPAAPALPAEHQRSAAPALPAATPKPAVPAKPTATPKPAAPAKPASEGTHPQ